jgi:hypothetical protein
MKDSELRAFWGDRLVRWNRAELPPWLEASAAEFLSTVGLPASTDWGFEGAVAAGPTDLHLVIAFDNGTPLIVQPRGDVVAMEAGNRSRFVNASPNSLLHFLTLYETYRERVRGLPEERAPKLVDETASAMTLVEPGALQDPDAYWSVILEQMRDGLL